jgi:hypothetical protein
MGAKKSDNRKRRLDAPIAIEGLKLIVPLALLSFVCLAADWLVAGGVALVMSFSGGRILVKQIAGILARRILCYAGPGDVLQKGERYGLICFGSRVDIFLPAGSEIKVRVGDKVKGGKDGIAVLN